MNGDSALAEAVVRPLRVVPPDSGIDLGRAERAARDFLVALGVPVDGDATAGTPGRTAPATFTRIVNRLLIDYAG